MKITKLGHCCMLIEHEGKRILTDPGAYSSGFESIENLDLIIITHEHGDHLHVPALKTVLESNPNTPVVTNSGVGALLGAQRISHKQLSDGEQDTVSSISLEAFGTRHEEIYKEIGQVENTGYLIASKLFYPGDAFTDPKKDIEILALPVEAPWMKISEAVEYALSLKPKVCFPVHDARLRPDRIGMNHKLPAMVLPESGIDFVPLKEGDSHDFS